MLTLKPIKRGQYFRWQWRITLEFAELFDTIKCQLKTSNDVLIDTLTIARIADTATHAVYTLEPSSDFTNTWPLGNLYGDIMHVMENGQCIYTKTFCIEIEKNQTNKV